MAPSQPTKKPAAGDSVTRHLQVHTGLEGFDEDLDTLMRLYEDLQLSSGDIANPELDLLTFASSAHFFGVLTEYEVRTEPPEVEEEDDKEYGYDTHVPASPFPHKPLPMFQRAKPQAGGEGSIRRGNDHEMDSVDDVEMAMRMLDSCSREDKEKAFQRGGVFVGPVGDKRFVSLGTAPHTPIKNQPKEDISNLTIPKDERDIVEENVPAHDCLWAGVDEDVRKSAEDTIAAEEDIYKGMGDDGGWPVPGLRGHNQRDHAVSFSASAAIDINPPAYDNSQAFGNYCEGAKVEEEESFWEGSQDRAHTDVYAREWDDEAGFWKSKTLDDVWREASGSITQSARDAGWSSQASNAYAQAETHRKALYDRRSKASKQPIIGLVYLANAQGPADYLRSGELNLGLIVDAKYRRRGYALQAVQVALEKAFGDQNCVRVQAVVLEGPFKLAALNVFMKSGFGHEGTRRRAFRSPYTMEFKDVTYLGILATDWFLRHLNVGGDSSASSTTGALPVQRFSVAPTSLWEEMFARHQREREDLLRWEEKDDRGGHGLKRTASNETIKEAFYSKTDAGDTSAVETTDSESVYASGKSRTSSVSGTGYHTSSSAAGPSPSKKAKTEKGKGKQAAHRSNLSSSAKSVSKWSSRDSSNRNHEYWDMYDSGKESSVGPETSHNINIGSWIAKTNASVLNNPDASGASSTNLHAIRSPSPGSSSESGFSELSAPADDSASEAGSELSFSSLPSEASLSSASSNWDIVDGIEYVSDMEDDANR